MPVCTVYISNYGVKYWFKNGKCHHDGNLPAVEYINGTKIWYKSGECHRDNDLPAIEFNNGDKYWYKNNLLYRDNDLPAIEFNNGNKSWYKNDIIYYPIIQLVNINMIKIRIIKMGNKWWYMI